MKYALIFYPLQNGTIRYVSLTYQQDCPIIERAKSIGRLRGVYDADYLHSKEFWAAFKHPLEMGEGLATRLKENTK